MNTALREKAIELRKQGLSYREIMAEIPVAKSTLGDWLHSVGLAQFQKQRLTEKKLAGMKRGWEARHAQRVAITKEIYENAKAQIRSLSKREIWLIGAALYWAEGSKEKEHSPGSRVAFTNGDPNMICLFLYWLKEICGRDLSDLTLDLYIHELQKDRTREIIDFWAKIINCDPAYFQHVYYKRGNPKTLRKNVGESYHGIIKINVKSSSSLNRAIAGWVQGMVESTRQ